MLVYFYTIMPMPFGTLKGLSLFILVHFFNQFFKITIQRIRATSILNWAVMVLLFNFHPLKTHTHHHGQPILSG
jgi:hypothetical protein